MITPRFVRASATTALVSDAATYVAQLLREQLQAGKRVVWLLSGGSAMTVAVQAATQLGDMTPGQLTIALGDERFGLPGHADSNWQQLMDRGLAVSGATLLPVLTDDDLPTTVQHFAAALQMALDAADYRIGLFGIGADGHTAGVLPHSPAVTAESLVCGYDGGVFQRITITPAAVALLDEAVVYATGKDKWPALAGLRQTLPLADQPAQMLKQVQRLTIFTDYHEGGKQ